MNLEEELNRSWNAFSSGVPVYHNRGRLEVDEPQIELPAVDPMGMATGAPQAVAPMADRPAKIDWNDPEQAKRYGTNSISPVDPTVREDGRDAMTEFLTGLGADPFRARDLSERVFGSTNPLSQHGIGMLDMALIPGAVMGVDESLRQIDDAIDGMKSGREGAALELATGLGMALLNAFPLAAGAAKTLRVSTSNGPDVNTSRAARSKR